MAGWQRLPTVRVGLLIDSYLQPVWVQRMLEQCLAVPGVELAVVVRNEAVAAGTYREAAGLVPEPQSVVVRIVSTS